jgi:hypothetical protein
MAQNTLRFLNLMEVMTQIHSAAAADWLRETAAGIQCTGVEAKLPNTEQLRAAITELQDLQADLLKWLREHPDRLAQLFADLAGFEARPNVH